MTDATDQRIRVGGVRVMDFPPAYVDGIPPDPKPEAETILSRLQSLSNRVQRLERLIGVYSPDSAR